MARIRLRVADIARLNDILRGTTLTIEEGLQRAGYDPAQVNLKHLQAQSAFTNSIRRCGRCNCWMSGIAYYREGCPDCGYSYRDRT